MTTIKSYTDIEQSRKLANILPVESVDMWYQHTGISIKDGSEKPIYFPMVIRDSESDEDLFCWSLTALLSVLPNEIITDNRFECHYQIHIRKYNGGDNTTLYQIAYGNDRGSCGSWHDMINTGEKDNLVDACYQMIIRLKELKML